jgi:GNAT superfamily N-acetyltransferase
MSEKILIRPHQKGEEQEIVDLLNIIFRKWPVVDIDSSLQHWKWKYLDNPIKKTNSFVALSQNQIIGFFGLFSNKLKIKNRVIFSNTGVDVGVHPDYRGKGVYSSLRNTANKVRVEEGFELSFGIETNPILIQSHEKRGDQGKFPFTAREDYKIIDIDLHYKNIKSDYVFFKKIGFKILSYFRSFRNLSGSSNNIQGINVFEGEYDPRLEKFFEKIENEHDFIFKKTLEHFAWRYFDSHGGNYVIKYAEFGDEIVGYIILSERMDQGYSTGYIVELITLSEFSSVEDLLIQESIGYFKERGVNFIRFLAISGKSVEKSLRRQMFFKGNPLYLTFTLGINDASILKWQPMIVNRVHFCYGDFDYI